MGQSVILKESTTEGDCYRCIHLQYRSPNVLEIFSKGLNKCFVHESLAMQSCPSETQIRINAVQEMMLFRSSDEILEQFCPFHHGHYQFTYTKETGGPFASDRCPRLSSKASNCPSAADIELNFEGCSFRDKTLRFKCLGDWRANETGEKFLALLEIDPSDESGPKYRCGLFHEDEVTGRAALTLSSDSTCQTNLYSASMGFESLQLRASPERPWPVVVRKGSCRFPEWSQGRWKDLSIEDAIMKHQSDVDLQTFSSHCIQQSNKNQNRFLIHSRSNCGSSQYNCVWFEQRGVNILEYQLGLRPSTIPSSELCDNDNFLQRTWKTQPKRDFLSLSSCPIAGDYTGILPDNPNFCAKLSSDCNNPDVMFYSVSSCDNQSQVLEENNRQARSAQNQDRDVDQGGLHPNSKLGDSFHPSRPRYERESTQSLSAFRTTTNVYDPFGFNTRFRKTLNTPMTRSTPTIRRRNYYFREHGQDPRLSKSNADTSPPTRFPSRRETLESYPPTMYSSTPFPVQLETQSLTSMEPDYERKPTLSEIFRVPLGSSVISKAETASRDLNQGFVGRRSEDREYQCLGQWEEDGQLFTYTKRRDVPGYECFIGSVDHMNGIYLIEGGVDCRRGLRVTSFGMKLSKRSNCYGFPSTELEKMKPKVNHTPWFTPTLKHPTNNPNHPGRTTHVITENDLVKWSNKPWTPIREPSSSSVPALRTHKIMLLVFSFYYSLRFL
ncbi:uncharacterized protein LOC131887268 isoform X2 [Tigriopus californicus]|nr:uncharacterized protein LOC131887268 isoform X2 [Tigriopus californicus]